MGDAREQMRKMVRGQISLVALLTDEGDALALDPEFSGAVEGIKPAFSAMSRTQLQV
jgi:hypothetical protein